jgi:hypothetical protein
MKVLPFLYAIPLVSAIGSRQYKRDVETLSLEKVCSSGGLTYQNNLGAEVAMVLMNLSA